MSGRLLLAGIRPDETPLDEWCSAAFAAIVDFGAHGGDPDKIEEFADKLGAPLPGEDREDLDRESWGTSEQAQEAQRRLLDSFGGAGPVG